MAVGVEDLRAKETALITCSSDLTNVEAAVKLSKVNYLSKEFIRSEPN